MKTNKLISIITVNYKQAQVTNQLLASLQQITYPNVEIIVVDNNSGDADLIHTSYANVKLICNSQNLGFSGGNNVGIKESKGEFVLLLNNDTEVEPDFLEPLVELLVRFQDIGVVSPKIKYFNQPDTIQFAGFSPMNPFTIRNFTIGRKERDCSIYNHIKETPAAHGCAMLVRRKVINEVGLMPEEYFLYYEEHDWSTTIKRGGYKIYYQPKSVVYHKESVSAEKGSTLKTYYLNRNRILFMRRNSDSFTKIVATAYLLFISIPKNIFSYLFGGKFGHLKAYLDALAWNISH
jgi:hypothetical protein